MSKQTFPRRFSWKIQSKFQNLSFTIIQNMPCFAFPLSQHRFYVLVSLYWCHRRYIPPSFAFIPGSDQLVLRCARLHTCAWAHAFFAHDLASSTSSIQVCAVACSRHACIGELVRSFSLLRRTLYTKVYIKGTERQTPIAIRWLLCSATRARVCL